ncbi:MAG TPA: hypothetical protein VHE35_28720, partial [Kofleriaceae bacterium]|nr:hypothetical protein [Kofleriaceae bacterium]
MLRSAERPDAPASPASPAWLAALGRSLAHAVVDGALAGVAAGVIDAGFVVARAEVPAAATPLLFAIVVGLCALAGV